MLIFKANGQTSVLSNNESRKIDAVLNSIDFSKLKIVGLPCPNSSTTAGSWGYEEAEKKKDEIYNLEPTIKYRDWINPTTGGAIHITNKDEIEVYQFALGIFQRKNDTAANYITAPKDTSVIVKSNEIWHNIVGIGESKETSVLITSEINLHKSEAIKKIMSELWRPGVQIYYLTKKE